MEGLPIAEVATAATGAVALLWLLLLLLLHCYISERWQSLLYQSCVVAISCMTLQGCWVPLVVIRCLSSLLCIALKDDSPEKRGKSSRVSRVGVCMVIADLPRIG